MDARGLRLPRAGLAARLPGRLPPGALGRRYLAIESAPSLGPYVFLGRRGRVLRSLGVGAVESGFNEMMLADLLI